MNEGPSRRASSRVKEYVRLMPAGKVPVISEYGIFRSTDTQVRSMTHALYIAKVMMEYVRLGSPYIQKHCLVDYYSSGADALGPTQQAVIQAVAQEGADTSTGEGDFAFFLTPSAFVFRMLNKGFGDEVLSASFSQQFTMSNGVTSLSSLVSRDQAGNLYFAIVNVDSTSDRRVKLDVSDTALAGKPMEIQLLNADSISAENTLEDPDNVQVENHGNHRAGRSDRGHSCPFLRGDQGQRRGKDQYGADHFCRRPHVDGRRSV